MTKAGDTHTPGRQSLVSFIRKGRGGRKEKRGKETRREDRREEGGRKSPVCPRGTAGKRDFKGTLGWPGYRLSAFRQVTGQASAMPESLHMVIRLLVGLPRKV